MGDKTKEVKTQLRLTMSQNLLGTKYERKKKQIREKKDKNWAFYSYENLPKLGTGTVLPTAEIPMANDE